MLWFCSLFLFFSTEVKSQCVIDTTSFEYFSPPADVLPCIEKEQSYEAVIQLFCPPQITNVRIDSIKVFSFSGLPNGISYQCNPPGCTIKSWEHACLLVSGSTSDTTGRYTINYSGIAYTSAGNLTFNQLRGFGVLPNYYFDVIDSGAACRSAASDLGFSSMAPSAQLSISGNQITLKYTSEIREPMEIQLFDLNGSALAAQHLENIPGVNQTMLQAPLSSGIYVLRLRTAHASQALRFIY